MLHAILFWPFFIWSPFHGLFSLLFLVLILGLIFGRRRYYYYHHPWGWRDTPGRSGALATLEERYARGEIQREEYLQKKQDLGG
ncbi:MAG: SHOCT domain-containing protein [Rhizomicrobium sp.]